LLYDAAIPQVLDCFREMRILAIDTSTRAGGAAILRDDSLLEHVFDKSQEEFSSLLFRWVNSLLDRTRLKLSDFDLFAVAVGPGSFTGLRVGLTAAKAWAEVFKKPIAAVSGLEAIAAQVARVDGGEELLAVVTNARRGQIFGASYETLKGRWVRKGEEVLTSADEFFEEVSRQAGGRNVMVATPEAGLVQVALASSKLKESPIRIVSEDLAPWIGRLAYGKAQRGELVDALTLDAEYVRRSDAEQYWKDS